MDIEKTYTSRNADKFVVRLPEGMRQRIAAVAKRFHRSMNSEIIVRLKDSLDAESATSNTISDSDIAEVTAEYTKELSQVELELILHFRQLKVAQQQALLNLLS